MPDYELAARRAAERYGVDPDIFVAQLGQESGLRQGLTSSAGARDIAQFIPSTARQYGVTLGDGRAADDLDGAARYMRDNLKRTGGDYKAALSIYNSGRPDAYKDPGFANGQTYNYVRSILGKAGTKGASSTPSPGTPPSAGGAEQVASPAPVQFGQGGDYTSLLGMLGQDQQQQASSPIPLPAALASASLPQGFRPIAPSQQAAPAQDGVSGALGLLDALKGSGPTSGASGAVPGSEGPGMLSPVENVQKQRAAGITSKNYGQQGKGAFEVSGPQPDRLQKPLLSFAERVANVFGGTLVGKDGSTHSKYTVNGNVSDHFTGNATDIFEINGKPAEGDLLLRAGRAALIAAGMPRKQAMKAKGGLYNVGSHQIIFLTNEGGNHFDHLHISAR